MKSGSQEGMGKAGTARGGFTMIEIIVVITIIAILTSLGLMVGSKVRVNSQIQATRHLIMSLDQALTAVESEKASKIPGVWRDDSGNEFAVIDGWTPAATLEPSQGLLYLASGQHPSLKETVLRIDPKFVTNTALSSSQTNFPAATGANAVKVPIVKDAWGEPLRFVHPQFDGGWGPFEAQGTGAPSANSRDTLKFKLRVANNPNPIEREFMRTYRLPGNPSGFISADEGLCTGGRGYFYSSGPDKDAGARDDNVYLDAPPKFPRETANLH